MEALEELGDEAGLRCGCGDFGGWSKSAEVGVDGDLFDEDGRRCRLLLRLGFGQVEAGDLEAVEEETGAAGIDAVGGDALEDEADGGLDGGAVLWEREVEGGGAAASLARVGDGCPGGVVVVAEFFSAEAGAAAAAAVGEDVAALVALGCGWLSLDDGLLHGVPSPTGLKVRKVFKRKDLSPYFGCRSGTFGG